MKTRLVAFDPSHPSTLLVAKDRHVAPYYTALERIPVLQDCLKTVLLGWQTSDFGSTV